VEVKVINIIQTIANINIKKINMSRKVDQIRKNPARKILILHRIQNLINLILIPQVLPTPINHLCYIPIQ
jgi:hypothetical protein